MHEMKKCQLCGFESKGLPTHLLFCKDRILFLEQYNITPEKLQEEYDNLGSVLGFMRKYPFKNRCHTFYYKIFKFYSVDYSIKKSKNHQNTKNKYKETCFQNHGTEHNFSKNCQNRKEWENRLFIEEGITNVFQREDVKRKIINTLIEKYGSESNAKRIKSGGKNSSYLNEWLFKILEDNSIEYNAEFMIKCPDQSRYYYRFDAEVNKKLIEINGDYWHGNPNIYKPNDLIMKGTSGEMKVCEKWQSDKVKSDHAKSLGFDVLVIWESEVKQNEQETIKKILDYAKS